MSEAEPLFERRNQRRRSLLFLSHVLPYPPDEGAHIRAWHLLRLLAREFDVTAVCLYRAAARPDTDSVRRGIDGIARVAAVHAFPVPQSRSRIRFMLDHVRSLLSLRPHTWYAYDSREYRRTVARLVRGGHFDVVHVDSLDLCAYLPLLRGIPIICGHHNVESELLSRRARREPRLMVRLYMMLQATLLRRAERRLAPQVALNLVTSVPDHALLARVAPGARCIVVPNGVDTATRQPAACDGSDILFMGGSGWAPNLDAMQHFCEEILPFIRQRRPDVQVTWLGRVPRKLRELFISRYGIRVPGFVDDLRPWLDSAACHVVPLRTGGGTRLKILDAWAAGQAVVSTSIGCEGLDAVDGRNILVRDDPADFAAAVCDVLEDAVLRARLGFGARETAVLQYDWEGIVARALPAYAAAATGADPAQVTEVAAA